MHHLKVRNVHEALPNGMELLYYRGYQRSSRYGDVCKIDAPVMTEYTNPLERVMFWTERDCNPFLHLFESLYLLAGRDDVFFMKQFAKRMEEFSDDGKTFHGSYGRRWRSWFKIDQIQTIIDILKKNSDDRRCVLQMWDATKDLGKVGKDFPCNTQVYFSVNQDNKLDMTVTQRSGDLVWGIYGANAVCFSVLQEYVAAGVGIEIGTYYQLTNNFHGYLKTIKPLEKLRHRASDPHRTYHNPYLHEDIDTTVVVDSPIKEWTEDLQQWLVDPFKVGIQSKFFLRTATPMFAAHAAHKKKDYVGAIDIIKTQMEPRSDWRKASLEWLERRVK